MMVSRGPGEMSNYHHLITQTFYPTTTKSNDIIQMIDAEHLMRLCIYKRLEFNTKIDLSDNYNKAINF